MKHGRIWISWGFQRRSYELARKFGAVYHDFSAVSSSRYRRYLQCIPSTIRLLHRSKQGLVFVQNPSLLLLIIVALGKRIFRYRYVNDLHTPYLRLNSLADSLFWRLQRCCAHHSEITIITNGGLAKRFPGADNIYVLPDKLPNVASDVSAALAGAMNVLFPSSFAEDEPYEEVKRAASLLDTNVHIYMTGRYQKAAWIPEKMPPNVHLTGFIEETEYLKLLNSVDAVLALTSQENCLLCGAYEGIAAGKPLVLSDTRALREYFTMGAVYVANDAESIGAGVHELRRTIEKMKLEVGKLRIILDENWRMNFGVIQTRLNQGR